MEYRIKEYCGVFEIQVKGHEEKGIFWWKKKERDWYMINAWGGIIQTWPVMQPICKNFKTLEAAKKRVEEFKKGAIYHYD